MSTFGLCGSSYRQVNGGLLETGKSWGPQNLGKYLE